jgi:hypothetical protein
MALSVFLSKKGVKEHVRVGVLINPTFYKERMHRLFNVKRLRCSRKKKQQELLRRPPYFSANRLGQALEKPAYLEQAATSSTFCRRAHRATNPSGRRISS